MTSSTHPEVVTYTADVSICSQICRLAVQEHHLHDAEDVHVDIEHAMGNFDPWFVRIQPRMTVPAMKYGDETILDSRDILYFLSEKHPEAELYPAKLRGDIDQFIDEFYGSFGAIGIFTFGNLQARGERLRQFINIGKTETTMRKLRVLADDPEFAEVAGAKLEQVKMRDFSRLSDPDLIDRAEARITGLLHKLEEKLADGREYVAGPTYSLADIVATALLARVHFIKEEAWFAPVVSEYWQRVRARPSFKDANVCATWESTLMSKQYQAFLETLGGSETPH